MIPQRIFQTDHRMSSQRPGSTLTHIRLGKYGLQLLSEIVEKMTEGFQYQLFQKYEPVFSL